MKQVRHKKEQNQPSTWIIILVTVVIFGALAFVFRVPLTEAFIPPTATPTAAPPPAMMIEQAGFVEVLQVEGVQSIYLFAEPNNKAEKVGQVVPGARGQLLGQDTGGEWLYIRIDNMTGWAPIYFFSVTAVR